MFTIRSKYLFEMIVFQWKKVMAVNLIIVLYFFIVNDCRLMELWKNKKLIAFSIALIEQY